MANSMPSILEDFIAKPPRERSGSRSANRFDYQLSWAFCLLLDLESKNKDYLLVLDYHDDVVVFDSENSPSTADFFQVKTETKKNWTLDRLLSCVDGNKLSILGKLYAHKLSFGDNVQSLNFITNARFNVKTSAHPNGTITDNCLISELCDTALNDVKKALQKEHGLEVEPSCDEIIVLRTDLLSLDHKTHAEGRFSQYLRDNFGDKTYKVVSHSFIALLEELRKRNNYEGLLNSKADIAKKSFGHAEFSSFLKKCAGAAAREKWEPIQKMLIEEQLDIFSIKRFELAWETREMVLLDTSDAIVARTQQIAESVVQKLRSEFPAKPLRNFINRSVELCRAQLLGFEVPISEEDILGAILSSITGAIK
jgi:hypothetical protein